MDKDKVINVRVDQDTYDKLVQLAIVRSQETKRVVRISEIVRDGITLVLK
jgi:hypothetical protein